MISAWWLLLIVPVSMLAGMALKVILGEHDNSE
jgi:hypothetical protein